MKKFLLLFFSLSVLLSSLLAENFQYSYFFADGVNRATGTLSGNQVGNSITGTIANLRVLSLSINGMAVDTDRIGGGDLFSAKWDVDSHSVPGPIGSTHWTPGAIVSFDEKQNNFIFSTIDLANGAFFSPNPHFGNFALNKDSALPNGYDAVITYYPYPPGYLGSYEEGTWSLKNTTLSPVPEPAAYSAIGSLVLFGLIAARRFRNNQRKLRLS